MANPRSTISGWVDGKVGDRFCGWVVDRADPLRRLDVEVILANGCIIQQAADRYRADVSLHGAGDGYSGFAVPMDWIGRTKVRQVFCQNPHVRIPGPARSSWLAPRPQIFRRGTYSLQIDTPLNSSDLSGWAVDVRRPQQRRKIGLRINQQLFIVQQATHFRSELEGNGLDGFHGFSLPLQGRPNGLIYVEDSKDGFSFPIKE